MPFYPVSIFNREGKLKKTISSKKLSEIYWKKINEEENFSKKTRCCDKIRKKLNELFPNEEMKRVEDNEY